MEKYWKMNESFRILLPLLLVGWWWYHYYCHHIIFITIPIIIIIIIINVSIIIAITFFLIFSLQKQNKTKKRNVLRGSWRLYHQLITSCSDNLFSDIMTVSRMLKKKKKILYVLNYYNFFFGSSFFTKNWRKLFHFINNYDKTMILTIRIIIYVLLLSVVIFGMIVTIIIVINDWFIFIKGIFCHCQGEYS